MRRSKVDLSVMFCVSFCIAYGNTLHVPGDYPSIQAAFVNAAANDTVLVAPGIYYEHLTWPNTQGIKLLSAYGPDTTIIDAAGALRCITIDVSVDSTTVITGFTIRNGNMPNGAGISCISASPSITNNIICNNTTGSGIWIDSGDPVITDNIIRYNTGGDGAGICCRMFSNPRIVGNLIEYNSATTGWGYGGGICMVDAQPIIENNLIAHNTGQAGGGIYTFKTYSIIRYNTITDNSAQLGGGINFYQSDAIVNYNDIFNNGCGITSGYTTDPINVENNWWGDATGPYHISNPGGLGDTVSDYLDFTPWLTDPHGIEESIVAVPVGIDVEINPNPFNHQTEIRFTIHDSRSMITKPQLRIYDSSGQLIKEFILPNTYYVLPTAVKWDGTDQFNRRLPNGVYFLRLSEAKESQTVKIVLMNRDGA